MEEGESTRSDTSAPTESCPVTPMTLPGSDASDGHNGNVDVSLDGAAPKNNIDTGTKSSNTNAAGEPQTILPRDTGGKCAGENTTAENNLMSESISETNDTQDRKTKHSGKSGDSGMIVTEGKSFGETCVKTNENTNEIQSKINNGDGKMNKEQDGRSGHNPQTAVGGLTQSSESADQASKIQEILATAYKPEKGSPETGSSYGVFFWNMDISWLFDVNKPAILETFSHGYMVPLSVTTEEEWKSVTMKSSFIILYYSVLSEKPLNDMRSYLEYFINIRGHKNVIFIIGDVIDTENEEAMETECCQIMSPLCYRLCNRLFLTELELDKISQFHIGSNSIERCIGYKLNYMRCILSRDLLPSAKAKHKVGIISRSHSNASEWLQKLLKSKHFQDCVKDITHFGISDSSNKKLKEEMSRCTFAILYFTSFENTFELELVSKFERKQVIVVIDGLEDSSCIMRSRILQNQPSIIEKTQECILFSRMEKESDYQGYLEELIEVEENVQKKLSQLEAFIKARDSIEHEDVLYGPMEMTKEHSCVDGLGSSNLSTCGRNHLKTSGTQKISSTSSGKRIVGIFSRSGKANYSWLPSLLTSNDFSVHVEDVRPHYISNNGFHEFRRAVSECKFGILYHSKNSGRVNVTDVTDSLYDMELEYLSKVLGKENVIVVIDDLEDSSEEEKERILQSQPKIRRLANDLIILSEKEKKSCQNNSSEKYKRIKCLLR